MASTAGQPAETMQEERKKLRKVLTRFDLVFFTIAAFISLDTIAVTAAYGGGETFFWLVVTILVWLVPYGMIVAELGSTFPVEGGPYVWPRMAFGRLAGSLTSVFYWMSNRYAGYRSETYLWPFFGYADTTAPKRYHETHYLWPFLVQGRGEEVYRNRWGPFYTHSVVKGYEKTWIAWPLFCRTRWTEDGLAQAQTRFFYVVYNSSEQRSAANPALAPARKTHLWPLFSAWDNGAGRRQFQLVSPLEVFFADNDAVHAAWNPLFALYRCDERGPGEVHRSVLFDLVTYRRRDDDREFHLGPLLGVESGPKRRGFTLAGGLFGFDRTPAGRRWRLFWLDFPRQPVKTEAPATHP